MRPERYFYLVDIDVDEIRAVFTADHIGDAAEMLAFERDLRAKCGVDGDPSMDLRDSQDKPLKASVWAQLSWKRAPGS